jgi:hypothetical protein
MRAAATPGSSTDARPTAGKEPLRPGSGPAAPGSRRAFMSESEEPGYGLARRVLERVLRAELSGYLPGSAR